MREWHKIHLGQMKAIDLFVYLNALKMPSMLCRCVGVDPLWWWRRPSSVRRKSTHKVRSF